MEKSTFAAPGSATTGLAGYGLEGATGNKPGASGKTTKADADYVAHADKNPCRACAHFIAPLHACVKVKGDIISGRPLPVL